MSLHGQRIQVGGALCTGCRLCEIACSLFHRGAVNPEGARVWVTEDWDRSLYEPHICQLCHPAPCTEACPLDALTQEAETGVIRVDSNLCNGCLACVPACPYGAIRWSDALGELLVCDRCDGEPACVPFCHRGALSATPLEGKEGPHPPSSPSPWGERGMKKGSGGHPPCPPAGRRAAWHPRVSKEVGPGSLRPALGDA